MRLALRSAVVATYAVGMSEARVWSVTSTLPTQDQALSLARIAVKERLAAGAEVTGPAVSVFWHLGELGEGEEWRVTLRTSFTARDRLAARLGELHPWESPEITASPITWCTDRYAEWVERTTTAAEPEG
jgi:periplasmic divalent cation tolerance protein